jgi:hypothetical protein
MKFLCIECDRPMSLLEARGPDRGSMTVLFGCPGCGRQVAMLTNSMETQTVASLGVTIGPVPEPDERPMRSLKTNLAGYAAERPDGVGQPEAATTGERQGSGGKCPFTGVVADAMAAGSGPNWTDAARARMERIPAFVRPMVQRGIEDIARRDGLAVIDEDVLARMRAELGM